MKAIVYMIILTAFLLSCEDKNVPDLAPQGPADLNLSAKTTEIIESDNEFGLELFKKVVAGEPEAKNIFISPTSVALALAMTYNGAAGETKTAMENALRKAGFSTEEINTAYKSLIEALRSVDPKVLLEIANSIWYREGFNVLPQFISVNEEYYNAEVSSLDFSSPQALAVINDWVSDQTNEKIKTIIDQIPANTVMYLINAIYFKGIWQYEFDKNNTFNGPFYSTDGSPVTVPYMKNKLSLPMLSTEKFSMLELPYGRGNYSMVILLPEEGYSTQDVINSLTPESWDSWVSSLAYTNNIDVQVPKFKFEYENLLNDELDNMGMGVAFSDFADFSGINGTGNLFISRVIHKSFVEVNEEGTTAAAVTAVEVGYTSVITEPVFHVDRPFVFAIRETTTGALVFIGRVQNPL